MVEGFAEKMEIKIQAPAEKSEEQERTEGAFAEEFAVTLRQMMKVMGTMMRLAIEKENSVVAMEESSLLKALSEKLPDYNSEILEKALLQLSWTKRDRLDKVPQGFERTTSIHGNTTAPCPFGFNLQTLYTTVIPKSRPSLFRSERRNS